VNIERPHFAAPFHIDNKGHVRVVEQDTLAEREMCVLNIAVCPEGFRLDEPTFGLPDPTFHNLPVDVDGLKEAIRRWESRGELTVTARAEGTDPTQQIVTVAIS
jgi:hypothetical protein